MEEQNSKLIQETVKEMLQKMGFEAEVKLSTQQGEVDNLICDVEVKENSNFLIGQHGINLQALQHMARLLVRKKTDDKVKFVLDVNGYRQEKNQSIVDLAKEVAEQAINEKRAVVMKPMSTYERRLVHLELSKNTDVVTESIGEGEGRKIVVKPAVSF